MKLSSKKFVSIIVYCFCGVATVLGTLWVISPSAGQFGLFLLLDVLYSVTPLFLGAALGMLGVKLFFGNEAKENLLKAAGKWGGQEDAPRFINLIGPVSWIILFYAAGIAAILDWLVTEDLFNALGIQYYIFVPHYIPLDPHFYSLSFWVSEIIVMFIIIVFIGNYLRRKPATCVRNRQSCHSD